MLEDGIASKQTRLQTHQIWEQLGFVLRYMHSWVPAEKLVEYIELVTCPGAAISTAIIKELTTMGLEPKFCRAQTYDEACKMAGRQNGCANSVTVPAMS